MIGTPLERLTAAFFLILTVAYSDLFIEPGNVPRWLLASVAVPCLVMFAWPRARSTVGIGAAFVLWAAITALWAVSPWMAVDRVWKVMLAGCMFIVAGTLSDRGYRLCVAALGVGAIVNVVVAFFEKNGMIIALNAEDVGKTAGIFVSTANRAAGLMVNSNYLAGALVLILVPMIVLRRKWLMAMGAVCLAGLAISLSKSAILALAVAAVAATWRRSRLAAAGLCLLAAGGFAVYVQALGADEQGRSGLFHQKVASRTILFANTTAGMTLFGHGAGSYWAIYPKYANSWLDASESEYSFEKRPRTAHNDFLTIGFEGGAVGLALYLWFISTVLRRAIVTREDLAAWLTFIAYLGLSLTDFPGFLPVSLFAAMLHSGYLSRPRSFCAQS